jgi:hypothetical protein
VLAFADMRKRLKIGAVVIGIAICTVGFCLAVLHARVQPNAAIEACKRNLRIYDEEVRTWTNANNLLQNSNGVSKAR